MEYKTMQRPNRSGVNKYVETNDERKLFLVSIPVTNVDRSYTNLIFCILILNSTYVGRHGGAVF